MRVPARDLTGDPAGLAVERRDLPVERHGALEGDVGAPPFDGREEHPIEGERLRLETADVHLDALRPQRLRAATPDSRVGVAGGGNHPPDAGGEDGVDARRGLADVIARLERRVERRVLGLLAGRFERDDLGVFGAGRRVVALADDLLTLRDDAADVRIRRRIAAAPELERARHVKHVEVDVAHPALLPRERKSSSISAMNSSMSRNDL